MSLPHIPPEIITTILDRYCETDYAYLEPLKTLSLVHSHWAVYARPKLFKRLHLDFVPKKGSIQDLIDILSSNALIRTSVAELHVANIFRGLSRVGGQSFWNPHEIVSESRERAEQEIQTVMRVLNLLERQKCLRLVLKHDHLEFGPPNLLVPVVASTLRPLTHLTIQKGPQIDLFVIARIATLECLELLSVQLNMDDDTGDYGGPQAALKRLVILNVEWAFDNPAPFSLVKFIEAFDLHRLESLAIHVDGRDPDDLLGELCWTCGDTLKEVSFHIRERHLLTLCKRWRSFERFTEIEKIHFYFPDGVATDIDHQDDSWDALDPCDPWLEMLRVFIPPPSLTQFSLGIKWHPHMSDNLQEWFDSQIPIMDEIIGREYFDSRWCKLKTVEFRLLSNGEDGETRGTDDLVRLTEAEMANIQRRGVQFSQSSEVARSNQWPYYTFAPLYQRDQYLPWSE